MDLITLILAAIIIILAAISDYSRSTTVQKLHDLTVPEDEKEDPDPPEEPREDSRFEPTNFYCGD